MRCHHSISGIASGAAVIIVACSSPDDGPPSTARTPTTVDCVAVLGTQPLSAVAPLAAVPVSGVAREKLISSLNDNELGRFCDYIECIVANGYNRTCYSSGDRFHPSPTPLLEDFGETCYPAGKGDILFSDDTREGCMQLYRTYFGTCHVGSWEDCTREKLWAPFGTLSWGPDCEVTKRECPVQ